MKNREEIQYKTAFNSKGELTYIQDVQTIKKQIFTCISCGWKMTPKIGREIRKRHFAHYKHNPECNGESYLHEFAKNLFYLEYNNCLSKNKPFFILVESERRCKKSLYSKNLSKDVIIKIGNCKIFIEKFRESNLSYCESTNNYKKIDLTKYFTLPAKLECNDGRFRPDVLLKNNKGNKLYIEFVVTNRVSQDKIINSGAKIIEIDVKYLNNLTIIKEHDLESRFGAVYYHNFELKRGDELCSNCDCYIYTYDLLNNSIPEIDLKSDKLSIADYINKKIKLEYIHEKVIRNKVREKLELLSESI